MGSVTDATVFSRNGETSPLGKATEELKCVVPEVVKEHFCAVAALNDKRVSEYLRDLIIEHLYGRFGAARMKVTGQPVNGERQE
jgi:hypothetical protein